MGGSTVKGLLKEKHSKTGGYYIIRPVTRGTGHFADTGVSITTDNQVAAESADIVAVFVKP